MKSDGLPVRLELSPACPFCHMMLLMEKSIRGGYVWGHPIWQEHWEELEIWICPNNAALFFQAELGAPYERLEPIV